MNHQEAKDVLARILPEDSLTTIKVETFRLSWEGKGYNVIAEETGYDHDYVRKAGSQLWRELTKLLGTSVTKRNFKGLLEEKFKEEGQHRIHTPEYPGSAMPFSSPFYVERSEEESRTYNEIARPGSVVRIKGPRKMGKSSLMVRVLDQADSEGYAIAVVDFQKADSSTLEDLERLLKWMCLQIDHQLEFESALDDYWTEFTGSKISCTTYLQDHILAKLDRPLVLVLNELNLLFDHQQVSKDFLPLLRSWYEESKHNQQMQKLRQVLIYSTEVYVQLDLNLSPFNIGLPVELPLFTGDQVAALASVYGFNWRNDGNLQSPITQMMNVLGGHPYLVQLTFYYLATESDIFESPSAAMLELFDKGTEPGGIYSDFLQQLLLDLNENENTAKAYRKVQADEIDQLTRVELYQLERLGVIQLLNGRPKPIGRMVASFLKQNMG